MTPFTWILNNLAFNAFGTQILSQTESRVLIKNVGGLIIFFRRLNFLSVYPIRLYQNTKARDYMSRAFFRFRTYFNLGPI